MNLAAIFKAFISTEGAVTPFFLHSASAQKISGVILAAEGQIPTILAALQPAAPAAPPTALPTSAPTAIR